MSTMDHAFFAAYRPANSPVASKPARPAPPPYSPASANSREDCDVTWYRLDQRHEEPSIPSPPHRKPELGTARLGIGTGVGVPDRGSSSPSLWQDHCVIVAPMFTADDVAAQAASVAPGLVVRPPMARESITRESRPALNDVPRAGSSSPPTFVVPARPPVIEDSGSNLQSVVHETGAEDVSVEAIAAETVAVAVQDSQDWKAVWEVDDFAWPEEACRLYESQRDYFRYAGEKLWDASREGLKVLAVAATREKEGCTTVAICLARAAAAAGAKVALFDANLTHPELGFRLGLDFSRGWQESLHDAPLAEAAVLSLDDGVTLFPLSATHPLTTLNLAGVTRTLKQAARTFDLILVDVGALPGGEAPCFESGDACPIHAALLIRDMRRTSETETLVTASRLKSLGIEAIGIAENFLPHASARSAAA